MVSLQNYYAKQLPHAACYNSGFDGNNRSPGFIPRLNFAIFSALGGAVLWEEAYKDLTSPSGYFAIHFCSCIPDIYLQSWSLYRGSAYITLAS